VKEAVRQAGGYISKAAFGAGVADIVKHCAIDVG
jgi:hypothetical protein